MHVLLSVLSAIADSLVCNSIAVQTKVVQLFTYSLKRTLLTERPSCLTLDDLEQTFIIRKTLYEFLLYSG